MRRVSRPRRVLIALLACALVGPPAAWARPGATVGDPAAGTAEAPATAPPTTAPAAPAPAETAADGATADASDGQAEPADRPSTTTMNEEQRRLYARGEAAARDGDWASAARYFRAAVSLGGFNLGFLGLGEALARQGRCAEAATALDAVPSSPAVPEAPARFADAMANAQRQALGRTCPGRLVVDCAAPMTRYRIIGGEEHACGDALELPAGRYRLRAGPDAMAVTLDAWVVGVETTRVNLSLPRPLPAEVILGPTSTAPIEPADDRWNTAGAVVLGLAGATLVAGGALHAVTLDAYLDAEDAADAVVDETSRAAAAEAYRQHADWRKATVGAYVAGGLLALTGLTLLLVDPDGGPARKPGSSLSAGPGWVRGTF